MYSGRELGVLKKFGREDWAVKDREPTERDFKLIAASAVAEFAYSVMQREPKKCDESEPEAPWPMVVIREGCRSEDGSRDVAAEEDAMHMYVMKYGMDQILAIWGADVGELLSKIESSLEEEPGASA